MYPYNRKIFAFFNFPISTDVKVVKQWMRKLYRIYSNTENIRLSIFISVTLNKYRSDCFFVYLFISSLLRARAGFSSVVITSVYLNTLSMCRMTMYMLFLFSFIFREISWFGIWRVNVKFSGFALARSRPSPDPFDGSVVTG